MLGRLAIKKLTLKFAVSCLIVFRRTVIREMSFSKKILIKNSILAEKNESSKI
ncbi:Hypothetical protein FKW44_004715, partial [Caligus rogercresseyi]